jgi:glycine cleavage system H protein
MSLSGNGSSVKTGLLYGKTHEWIDLSESPAKVGISDYAQKNLHDVVYVELPKVGQSVTKGSTFCTLESVKAVAEVYAPVDGTVIAVNEKLDEKPDLVNKDPYGEGWLVRLEVKAGNSTLLSPEGYAAFLKTLA